MQGKAEETTHPSHIFHSDSIPRLQRSKGSQARQRLARGREHGVARARAAQRRVVQPRRLPVEQAHAAADALHGGRDILQPCGLARRREGDAGGVAGESVLGAGAACRPVCLGDNDLLAPLAVHVAQRGLERGEGCAGVVEGIVGHSHHVKICREEGAGSKEALVEPLLQRPLPAIGDVDHDLGLGGQIGVLDSPCGGVQETSDIAEAVVVVVARGEEQTVRDLVADGDDLGRDARGGKGVGHG